MVLQYSLRTLYMTKVTFLKGFYFEKKKKTVIFINFHFSLFED